MRSLRRLARLVVAAIGLVAVLGPAGCGVSHASRQESWQLRRAVEELSRSRTIRDSQSSPPVQARPVEPTPKPRKAVEDSDERHPSRWKRKLKAAYA